MELARAQLALRDCRYPQTRRVIRASTPGATSVFTVLIVANPVPARHPAANRTTYVADPVIANAAAFDAAAAYIDRCLFGEQTALAPDGVTAVTQAEQMFKDPAIQGKVRVELLFIRNLEITADHALVEEMWASNILKPRQDQFDPLVRYFGAVADVIYAVSLSPTHTRASALPMKDDASAGGVAFTYDGAALTHWYETLVPGAVAIHSSATTLTALHEFGHAAGSTTAGMVIDLDADTSLGYPNEINFKSGRPIPTTFATLDGVAYERHRARRPRLSRRLDELSLRAARCDPARADGPIQELAAAFRTDLMPA